MSLDGIPGIIPRIFKPFLFPQVQQQVIADWLLWEVINSHSVEKYPILREISGWRRKEIRDYCLSQHDFWDARLAATYGLPGAVT